jgi:hypothetical protein
MPQIMHLQHQQHLAESSAAGATSELNRREHENLARAYEKIIEVLKRARFQASSRRGGRI